MIPPIPPIPPITSVASAAPASATPEATAASGTDGFANMLGSALDQLNTTTSNAETLAIEGATGQANVADVTVAATEAQLAVQLATTVRNEGVTALNSIMSMQAG
jgi:flagellar hook-basal body complex protein FliE